MAVEKIDLVRDTTMRETNRILAAIAGNTGGLAPKSWADVQAIVRDGLADKFFSIGDQFTIEKETSITATVGNTDGAGGITAATVNANTFLSAVGTSHSGEYEFTYNGAEWHYNGSPVTLTAYGITVTGTAKAGDEVLVHETASKLVFDVIGIDHDTPSDAQFTHSLTLQMHDCYTSLQFDKFEAFYYCETELPAGTYNVTCGVNWGTNCVAGKTYQFTLTKSVPAGGQLVGFERMPDTTIGSWTVHTYASNSSTAEIESATVTEGSGGTSLGTFQAAVQGNLNSLHRLAYGSNNYLESAIRQVINSDKAAGSVWTPKTKFDRPPTWATSEAGFLSGVDADFLSVLGKVKKVTARNTVSDGGGSDTSDELIFLLSRSEIYAGLENNVNEGSAYPYYANYSDLTSAGTGNDGNRIKYRNGSAQYWCLRSPTAINDASHMRYVSTSGALSSGNAYNSYGVAPACCIV